MSYKKRSIITVAPTDLPLTTADLKLYLRIDSNHEDGLIDAFQGALVNFLQNEMRMQIMRATRTLYLDAFPTGSSIELDHGPIDSIVSVKYYDADDVEQTVDSGDYYLDTVVRPPCLILASTASWPSSTFEKPNAVAIEYLAGYEDAASVPPEVGQAIKMIAKDWYDSRGNFTTKPNFYNLVVQYRDVIQGLMGMRYW